MTARDDGTPPAAVAHCHQTCHRHGVPRAGQARVHPVGVGRGDMIGCNHPYRTRGEPIVLPLNVGPSRAVAGGMYVQMWCPITGCDRSHKASVGSPARQLPQPRPVAEPGGSVGPSREVVGGQPSCSRRHRLGVRIEESCRPERPPGGTEYPLSGGSDHCWVAAGLRRREGCSRR